MMTEQENTLWLRIQHYAFDTSRNATPITEQLIHRLHKNYGWEYPYAQQAIREYCRFIFLSQVSNTPVTPSEPIDKVWHEHLLHTKEYWEDFCPHVLEKSLHHTPSLANPKAKLEEKARFAAQYEKTLELYRHYFWDPPPQIWPEKKNVWQEKKKSDYLSNTPLTALVGSVVLTGLVIALEIFGRNPLTLTGSAFLTFYSVLFLAAWGGANYITKQLFETKERASGDIAMQTALTLDKEALAYLSGQEKYTGIPTLTDLLERGILRQDGPLRVEKGLPLSEDAPYWEGILYGLSEIDGRVAYMLHAFRRRATSLRHDLEQNGLGFTESEVRRIHSLSTLPFFCVSVLGLTKVIIGFDMGRPLGLLLPFAGATMIFGLFYASRPLFRTRRGEAVLAEYKKSNTEQNPPLKVAINGWEAFPMQYGLGIATIAAMTARLEAGFVASSSSNSSSGGGGGGCGSDGCGGGDGGDGGGCGGGGCGD
jgi:uncharacterized protein (TIGR04222 family)